MANIGRAADVAVQVLRLGHSVICPHTMTAPFEIYGLEDDVYLNLGLDLLELCDAVCLVQGPGLAASEGTRAEIEWATMNGMVVYQGPEEMSDVAE